MDERKHVLVVDDYDDGREMYAEFLELAGYQVSQARSGGEALSKAEELVPDVILMDLSLPDMDGSDVIRRLRTTPSTRNIPVVVVTGHSREDLETESIQYEGFVTKPCPPEALVAEIARLVESGRSAGGGRRRR